MEDFAELCRVFVWRLKDRVEVLAQIVAQRSDSIDVNVRARDCNDTSQSKEQIDGEIDVVISPDCNFEHYAIEHPIQHCVWSVIQSWNNGQHDLVCNRWYAKGAERRTCGSKDALDSDISQYFLFVACPLRGWGPGLAKRNQSK